MYTIKSHESVFFNENIKMSDVVLSNNVLLDILPHFGIVNLGWNNKTIKEVCDENNISIPVFLSICNLYTFDGYDFTNKLVLERISIQDILDYLQKSHKYILEFRLPQIRNTIIKLQSFYRGIFGNYMGDLAVIYEREVSNHIKYEEEVTFFYIVRLLNGDKTGNYKISDYNNNHYNIEAAISDLNNIILNYLPQDSKITICRELLFDLFMFEYALKKHRMVEDQILVPLVIDLEEKRC